MTNVATPMNEEDVMAELDEAEQHVLEQYIRQNSKIVIKDGSWSVTVEVTAGKLHASVTHEHDHIYSNILTVTEEATREAVYNLAGQLMEKEPLFYRWLEPEIELYRDFKRAVS